MEWCKKVWWRWVGAVPVCPPVSPHRGAAIVKFPAHNACVFGMETSLRGRSGGHTGAAPTVSFGQITRGWLVSFGWIACKWLFCSCRIAWKNMMEIGRGGACVPARVALQGRIHRPSPRTMHVFLVWKRRCADVRAGTQAPPLPFQHLSPFCKGENKKFGARS